MISIIGSIYLREFSLDRESALSHSKNFATNSSYFQINNCTNNINNDFVQCLKNISGVELNTAQQLFFYQEFHFSIFFKPVYGTELLPKDINKAIIDGDFKRDVNLLIGHQEMESVYFTTFIAQVVDLNGRYNNTIYLILRIIAKLLLSEI